MQRRFTFGNERPAASTGSAGRSAMFKDMNGNSSASGMGRDGGEEDDDDDFAHMRQRFDRQARDFRQDMDRQRDGGFDRWFENADRSFGRPAKEDERSAYVRNIPIFQQQSSMDGGSSMDDNLMRQNTSAIPRPVPPQTQSQSHHPHHANTTNIPPLHRSPPQSRQPGVSASGQAQTGGRTRNHTSTASRDSGIDHSGGGTPANSSESVSWANASSGSGSGSGARSGGGSSSTLPRTNLTKVRTDDKGGIDREKEVTTIPVNIQSTKSDSDEVASKSSTTSTPIPMGFLPRQRDPKQPIPMGFERPASAPGERLSPLKTDNNNHHAASAVHRPPPNHLASSNNKDSNLDPHNGSDATKVHRVPIVVREDSPRSSSAPPKPTEATPTPPALPVTVKTPLEKINDLLAHIHSLQERIDRFVGTGKDREYRLIDELLTQTLIKLDAVEPAGVEAVRVARKTAIKKVEDLTHVLETKSKHTVQNDHLPESTGGDKGEERETTRMIIAMSPEKDVRLTPTSKKVETEI